MNSTATLRGWIESNGGHAVLASTLSAVIFSTKLVPDWSSTTSIKGRFPHDLASFTQDLGSSFDSLTNREARFVEGIKNHDSL